MVFPDSLKSQTVNLPVVGAVSIATVGVGALILFFLLRRKKSISLKI